MSADASVLLFLLLYVQGHCSEDSTVSRHGNSDNSSLRIATHSRKLVRRDRVSSQADLRADDLRNDAESQSQSQSLSSATHEYLPKSLSKYLVGLNYIFPSSWTWDSIHDGHTSNDGGVWDYSQDVESALELLIEIRHPQYDSAWDVACNIGFFLKRLAYKHPFRQYFGSDISSVMVESTRSQCPRCVVETFDLSQLQYSGVSPPHIHEPVDIIIVADVLNYIAWGGLPPIWNWLYPAFLVRNRQIEFMRQLTRLARKEVIFSARYKDNNTGIIRFMNDMGLENVIAHIWVAKGTAGTTSDWAPPANLQNGNDGETAIMKLILDLVKVIFAFVIMMAVWIGLSERSKRAPAKFTAT